MDYGHAQTDRQLKKLEKALTAQYGVANKELEKKVQDYFDRFAKRDENKVKQLKEGKITEKEYLDWRKNEMLVGEQWREVRDTVAKDLTNVNKISASMITDGMADAYAINANYGMYEVEQGIHANLSFSLYSKPTVERMIKDKQFPIPTPKVDVPKDQRWNKQKINSAMLQGVLQGDNINKIAKRLQSVTDMNRSSAIRNARTYITGAENRGRVDSYKYAESLGIQMENMWLATLDGRTRDSHRHQDGMCVPVGEVFPNGCEYPGDPDCPDDSEIYNCRCTLIAQIKGHERDLSERKSDYLTENKMSYEDWVEMKDKMTFKGATKYSVSSLKAPERPHKSDYKNDDEYRKAFESYKKEKEEYNKKFDYAVKNALEYKRFNSKDDVRRWAESQGIKVTEEALDKIDLKAFNETSVALDKMFERFPEVKNLRFEDRDGSMFERMFQVGIREDGLLSANGGFNFNPRYFDNYEYGLRDGLSSQTDGFFVRGDGTFSSIVRHEYGHNVQDYIELSIADKYHHNVDDWRKNFNSFEEFKASESKYWEEKNQFKNELMSLAGLKGSSEYSNTNDMELFAEGFAAYTSGEQTEFAKGFGEFLKRWY